jgi:hypothetical protein
VLDGRIADGLQDRLERVETSLDETVAAIDQKNIQIEELERYIEASAPFAVDGRLEATSTLVVAETGVDAAPVEDLVRRLRESGSRVEGIIWLEPRWDLAEPDDLSAAAELAGVESTDPQEIRAALLQQLLTAGEPEPVPTATTTTTTTTTTSPAGTVPGATLPDGATTTTEAPATTTTEVPDAPILFDRSPLSELVDAGLVRIQRTDSDLEAPGGELLIVAATGAASTLAEPGAAAIELVRIAADSGVPSVLAEVTVPPEEGVDIERGEIINTAFESGAVAFSTVDDLELIAGRVASVLALAELREGNVGRFGYGPDVDGVLPPWQGP